MKRICKSFAIPERPLFTSKCYIFALQSDETTLITVLKQHTITRSTGTVHTSTKAHLTSVAIQIQIHIQICDPDRQQNLIICSLAHCQPYMNISCKSVWRFLRKVANRQTDRQTNKQWWLHILLGRGNNTCKMLAMKYTVSMSDEASLNVSYNKYTVCRPKKQATTAQSVDKSANCQHVRLTAIRHKRSATVLQPATKQLMLPGACLNPS